jgi:hypothetical protein
MLFVLLINFTRYFVNVLPSELQIVQLRKTWLKFARNNITMNQKLF